MGIKNSFLSRKVSLSVGTLAIGIGLFGIASATMYCGDGKKIARQEAALETPEIISFNNMASKLVIDTGTAKSMVRYYDSTAPTGIVNHKPLVNPLFVNFDLKPLLGYLIKAQSSDSATGVRVYFGRYHNKKQHPSSGDLDYTNHATVIFVPVKTVNGTVTEIGPNQSTTYYSYNPYNGGNTCPPHPPQYCQPNLLSK